MERSKTYVIVPTYNEKENLSQLVPQLLASPALVHVIVVDDNSPDGTGKLADMFATESPRVHVIHRAGKMGLGTAYIAGFKQALQTDADFIITMDADFSHHPRYLPDLVTKAEAGCDLVIGSRYVPGGATLECTLLRKLLSWGANAFARTMLGLRTHDSTAGFRCYRREVLTSIPLDQIVANGYSFLIEMLYYVQRGGWQVCEVPIVFQNRQQGVSKISRAEIYKAFQTVVRLSLRRLTGGRQR